MDREKVMLQVASLSKKFGAVTATDAVGFSVQRGEIVGLIGPNGAGKTTLANLITGALPKTAGRVTFNGTDISGMKPYQIARLGLTRTFQVVQPLVGMSVEENVLVGALYGRAGRAVDFTSAKSVADSVLAMVGLDEKRHKPVSDITLPDLKRMEFARVLAMEPELVILDEVMAGLNPAEVDQAMAMVRQVRDKQGLSIIFIEHIMRAVMDISDRIIVLHHGKKIVEGSPRDVAKDRAVIEAYLGKRYARACESGESGHE